MDKKRIMKLNEQKIKNIVSKVLKESVGEINSDNIEDGDYYLLRYVDPDGGGFRGSVYTDKELLKKHYEYCKRLKGFYPNLKLFKLDKNLVERCKQAFEVIDEFEKKYGDLVGALRDERINDKYI